VVFQPRRTALIGFVVGVLSAIGLDHQAMLDADEVEDERAERMLATEFISLQPSPSKRRP
jgi:hypothetical protein